MGRLIDEDIVIDIINFECGKWTGLSKTIEKEIKALPSAQPDAIPLDWIQRYADDWEDIGYAYENPILGMLEDWREEQDDS